MIAVEIEWNWTKSQQLWEQLLTSRQLQVEVPGPTYVLPHQGICPRNLRYDQRISQRVLK